MSKNSIFAFALFMSSTAFGAQPMPPSAVGEMPTANPPHAVKPLECTPDINEWGFSSACNCPSLYKYDQTKGACLRFNTKGTLEGNFPAKGSCSDANGEVKLTVWRYESGVAPRRGTVVSRSTLSRNAEMIGDLVSRTGGGTTGFWSVNVNLDPETRVEIDSKGNQLAGSSIYAIVLTVTNIESGEVEFSKHVICENSWNHMLP